MSAADTAMDNRTNGFVAVSCGEISEGSRDVFGRVWVLGMVGYFGEGPDVFGMTRKGLMFLEGAGVGCSR